VCIQTLNIYLIAVTGSNLNGIFIKDTRAHGLPYKNHHNSTQPTPQIVTNVTTTPFYQLTMTFQLPLVAETCKAKRFYLFNYQISYS
jgi:hypothetical protein